jgi:hypothetical protein
VIRRLIAQRSDPFQYEGRFDRVSMAHYDCAALPGAQTILAAGVGEQNGQRGRSMRGRVRRAHHRLSHLPA